MTYFETPNAHAAYLAGMTEAAYDRMVEREEAEAIEALNDPDNRRFLTELDFDISEERDLVTEADLDEFASEQHRQTREAMWA